MIATIARTTIMPANRTRFVVMAFGLGFGLGFGFGFRFGYGFAGVWICCAVFVGFRITLHGISITIEGR
jgi:hypothetical protein